MLYQVIDLPEQYPALKKLNSQAKLYAYAREQSPEVQSERPRPAVLILPGGAYRFTSDREAEPVALHFLASGYQAFVLRYTCAPARYPTQLTEAAAAMKYLRENADKFFADADRVAVIGFSAGGHLAGTLSCLWDTENVCTALSVKDSRMLRPNAACLCYPVITSEQYAHCDSFCALLGENPDEQLLKSLSLEHAVRADMPPVFLWHTANDDGVPVQNSLLFANALLQKEVSCELHVFDKGVHGLSLASPLTAAPGSSAQVDAHCAHWAQLFVEWMQRVLP